MASGKADGFLPAGADEDAGGCGGPPEPPPDAAVLAAPDDWFFAGWAGLPLPDSAVVPAVFAALAAVAGSVFGPEPALLVVSAAVLSTGPDVVLTAGPDAVLPADPDTGAVADPDDAAGADVALPAASPEDRSGSIAWFFDTSRFWAVSGVLGVFSVMARL